ncbi:hypothetical protein OVA11_14835 [Caulobacter sp. SL161]|uniref:hypothetical protein n=1 Tax=Caulobacter sp. SL161 TaxID=2995156 RepID=UPI002276F369|nr:hypothetical protein [Caulobacter sp. SL161]MCY1648292.1 hypothetical protein [Caulobacter sp. SL161]
MNQELGVIQLYVVSQDQVIKSAVGQGSTTYRFALDSLFPLINKFEEQRKVQRRKFYERLKNDILKGCQMPPITLAFVNRAHSKSLDAQALQRFVNANIGDGYILDGMQRLNTLKDASQSDDFVDTITLPMNIIIAERYDLLLYRMITLNNGQKPMTARHQIEMLTKGMLDTANLGIEMFSEKDTENAKAPAGAFRQADIAEAYTAFLTDSVHNQNSRIIESKLDEILVGKVMDSDLTEADISFRDVLVLVEKFAASQKSKDWLRIGNNLIGFTVGAKRSHKYLSDIGVDDFEYLIRMFEEAFDAINVSKINVGKMRRELSMLFFEKAEKFRDYDVEKVTEKFHEATLVE